MTERPPEGALPDDVTIPPDAQDDSPDAASDMPEDPATPETEGED
jgi:hypothetical protein